MTQGKKKELHCLNDIGKKYAKIFTFMIMNTGYQLRSDFLFIFFKL